MWTARSSIPRAAPSALYAWSSRPHWPCYDHFRTDREGGNDAAMRDLPLHRGETIAQSNRAAAADELGTEGVDTPPERRNAPRHAPPPVGEIDDAERAIGGQDTPRFGQEGGDVNRTEEI